MPFCFSAARIQSRHASFFFICALSLCFMFPARADLVADVAPSGNFDLTHWSLTIPVNSSGGTSGTPATITPATLSSGYSSAWFYTASDGSMTFWAPVNGISTSGSEYPRSELHEMLNPTQTSVNWTSSSYAKLDAKLKVLKVPSATGKVTIGQIHGYDSGPCTILVFAYNASTATASLYAKVYPSPTSTSPTQDTLATGLTLSKSFTYLISVTPGKLSMSVNGATATQVSINSAWDGVGLYFKAGAFTQATGTSSTDGGEVTFYRLAASHPNNSLSVAGSSTLPAAVIGRPYSATLSASGGSSGQSPWGMVSGQLPPGLKIDTGTGIISGTPTSTTTGSHSFSVLVTDSLSDTASRNDLITISAP